MSITQFTTSGSTGDPKEFPLTEDHLLARSALRGSRPGLRQVKSLFCALPVYSTAATTYRMWALSAKVVFRHSTGSIERDILLIKQSGVDGIIGRVQDLLNYSRLFQRAHPIQCVIATGSTCSPSAVRAIQVGFGAKQFTLTCGASETGSWAVASEDLLLRFPGTVGKLLPGVEVQFASGGLIGVKTSTMFDGYTDPSLTSKYVRDGFFWPGDAGNIRDGLLFIRRPALKKGVV